ncbi:MAG: M2 family metallopeptidase [Deltaproteobacteria bacterium]|nr:M2 family metallopeptidase [Deltaproteobacteria bacterium]
MYSHKTIDNSVLKLLLEHESRRIPVDTKLNYLWWDSATGYERKDSGQFADYSLKFWKLYNNRNFNNKCHKLFEKYKDNTQCHEYSILKILVNSILRNRVSRELKERIDSISGLLEHRALNYRPVILIGGKRRRLTSMDIHRELNNSGKRDRVNMWDAGRRIGKVLYRTGFPELVRIRNRIALDNNFSDFHRMSLYLDDIEPQWLDSFMERLADVTETPFLDAKAEIDSVLSSKFSIPSSMLMPWHYGDLFFQEVPSFVNQEPAKKNISNSIDAVISLFKYIGLDISDVIEKSDFGKRKNKIAHAYCLDMDRQGDIRIIATETNDQAFVSTLLHECGHAAYFRNIDKKLNYIFRSPAHLFLSEGIAMFMQSLQYEEGFLKKLYNKSPGYWRKYSRVKNHKRKIDNLVFIRWSLVMYFFERELYRNPEQDLQKLWWFLVNKYQKLNIPTDRNNRFDWLSKIHIVTNPVYYHNYLLGAVFSDTLRCSLGGDSTGGDFIETLKEKKFGDMITENLFSFGKSKTWNSAVLDLFGKPLQPEMINCK